MSPGDVPRLSQHNPQGSMYQYPNSIYIPWAQCTYIGGILRPRCKLFEYMGA